MSWYDKILGRGSKTRTKIVGLQAIKRALGSAEWENDLLLEQYSKSVYVFAAVNKIAQKTASLPIQLFEIKNSKGEVDEHDVHPVLDLMYKPNPFQVKTEFFKITITNRKLCGEAFIQKIRDPRGQVVELWNLRPDYMTIVTDPEEYILRYEMNTGDGGKIIFAREDIIHIKDPNPLNTYRGISPLSAAQYRVETETHATRYQRDFFLNNARPDAFLLTEDLLGDDQKAEMKETFEQKHRGPGKNSKLGILEGGVTYQQVSISQREMDYIESLKFTRDDILVAFGVPKSVVTTDDVNLANANTGMHVFLSETIKPEMQMLVDAFNEMLVIPDFGEQFYIDFEDPTPKDRAAKINEYTAGVDKWITRNEIRRELGLEDMPGGDQLYNEFSKMPINEQGIDDEEEPMINENAFKGKSKLKEKFLLIEGITKDVDKVVANIAAKTKKISKKKKKTFISIVTGEEIRTQYADMVIKGIDRKAREFQRAANTQARAQQERVVSALKNEMKSFDEHYEKTVNESDPETIAQIRANPNHKKDYAKEYFREKLNVFSIIRIFDKKKEDKVLAGFALPFLTTFLTEAGNEALDLVKPGTEFIRTARVERYLNKRAEFFADSVNDTTLTKLTSTLAEGIKEGEGIDDLTRRVKDVYSEFETHRAERIARTETTAVNNEGFLEGYQQSNVVRGKEWIATLDGRTREEHLALNGEKVEINSNFSNGLSYPSEPNCRCVIAPVVIEE